MQPVGEMEQRSLGRGGGVRMQLWILAHTHTHTHTHTDHHEFVKHNMTLLMNNLHLWHESLNSRSRQTIILLNSSTIINLIRRSPVKALVAGRSASCILLLPLAPYECVWTHVIGSNRLRAPGGQTAAVLPFSPHKSMAPATAAALYLHERVK